MDSCAQSATAEVKYTDLRAMASQFFNWTFGGAPVSVNLDVGVVDRVGRKALRARQPETGILLGSATADSPIRVTITGFRPVSNDDVKVALDEYRHGPAVPVGYY